MTDSVPLRKNVNTVPSVVLLIVVQPVSYQLNLPVQNINFAYIAVDLLHVAILVDCYHKKYPADPRPNAT